MQSRALFGLALAVLLALVLTLVPFITSATTASNAPARLIESEGRIVSGPFLRYIERRGGLALFGQPLTDELIDTQLGVPVQYFTHARLELHGGEVRLTRLGSLRAHGREAEAPFLWLPPETSLAEGRVYVPESGHTLGGAFAWYYQSSGGVELLGHPISEELYEMQPDGSSLLVQYFERALLSYHPGPGGADAEVRREPLGLWMARTIFPPEFLAPGRPLLPLGSARLTYTAGTGSGRNIELAAARLDGLIVEPGAELSFLNSIGEISTKAGFAPGPAIVDGAIVGDMVGGGVCVVSTLLYRAIWSAGLPIQERAGHRLLLDAFADAPGLEAAVYAPAQDLRARNDTGERLYVAATARDGTVTVTLWGRGDGRRVDLARPTLSSGESLTAVNIRVVRTPGGAVRKEQSVTRYELPPLVVASP